MVNLSGEGMAGGGARGRGVGRLSLRIALLGFFTALELCATIVMGY